MKNTNKNLTDGNMLKNTLRLLTRTVCGLGLATGCFAAGTLTPAGSGVAPVKIKSHHVKVTLNNGFARTEVNQRFHNQNTRKVEATYAFPLPKSASLSEVTVQVGEKSINGEVVDKKKAESIYGKEKAAGNKAGLATKNGYQDFKFQVSNINPGEDVSIKFVYYQPLKIDTGAGRYVYPLEEGNTDEAAQNFWERNDKVEGKTTIEMNLKSAWPLANVRAPGCAPLKTDNKLQQGSYKATYELTSGLKKDFVFYYLLEKNLPGRLEVIPYHQPGAKDGTFMMVVTPGLDLKPLTSGADYVFLLDVSGSMSGDKIRTLSDGISRVIGKMQPHDRFKIVTFENSAHNLTRGWVAATPENVNKWINKVKKISAGGGTNLYDGIKTALKNLDADRVSSIIMVTDAVTNTGVIAPKRFHQLLKKYDVRVFGFLMGNSGNWPLMRQICNTSGGFYAGVSNSDDIIGQVMQAKKKITHECLRDARIEINGVNTYDLTGENIGKVYCGQQLVVFGRYQKGGKATVKLKAKLTGQEKVYSTTFDFPTVDTDNPELERLWAMSRIEMFEDLCNAGLAQPKETESIVRDLGVNYQLVTDETSMLVLSDDTFKKYNIKRRNQKRLAIEHKAQAKRAAQPTRSYRVDKGKKRMFKHNAPRLGGGGAIDPATALMMLLSGILGGIGLITRRNKK